MKKIIALAIVAGFVFSFAACGGKKAEEAPAQEAAPTEQAEQPADTSQQASDTTQQQ